MTSVKILSIVSVTVNGTPSTNILAVRDEFKMTVVPKFRPNTYSADAGGVYQSHKWREVTFTFDSETSVFDTYVEDDAANPVIPSLVVVFNLTNGNTETWTYEASKSYVMDKPERIVDMDTNRNTSVYKVMAIGTKAVVIA